jgi:hypothetical protein
MLSGYEHSPDDGVEGVVAPIMAGFFIIQQRHLRNKDASLLV